MKLAVAIISAALLTACSVSKASSEGQVYEETGVYPCSLSTTENLGNKKLDGRRWLFAYRFTMPGFCHDELIAQIRKRQPEMRPGERYTIRRKGWTTELMYIYSDQSNPISS